MTKYEKPIRFSCEEMYELGAEGSNRESCTFDFSFINSDDYYVGFFNTLPNMIYKKCVHLRFCNDFERALEERNMRTDSEDINKDFKTYENSIRFKKPGYSNYLAKIVGKALPRTKLLTSLEFDQIPFSEESFRLITNAIKKTRELKSITFSNLKVQDKDFEYFLEKVSPFRLDNISFINCHISGNTYDALKEYVNKKEDPANKSSKFTKIILKGNGIKYNQRTGEVKRRFKPQDLINERDIVEIKMNWNEENPNANDQDQMTKMILELRNLQYLVGTVKPAEPTNDLRKQNENLKKELNELLYVIKAVKYNDDVYFIGEGADAGIEKIRKVEGIVQDYESKHGTLL